MKLPTFFEFKDPPKHCEQSSIKSKLFNLANFLILSISQTLPLM